MGAELTSDRVDLGNGVDLVHVMHIVRVLHPEPIMGGAVTSAQQPMEKLGHWADRRPLW